MKKFYAYLFLMCVSLTAVSQELKTQFIGNIDLTPHCTMSKAGYHCSESNRELTPIYQHLKTLGIEPQAQAFRVTCTECNIRLDSTGADIIRLYIKNLGVKKASIKLPKGFRLGSKEIVELSSEKNSAYTMQLYNEKTSVCSVR